MKKLTPTTFASICVLGTCQAATISIDNIDPNAGTYSGFTAIATSTDSFQLTQTFDFDGGGVGDILTFDLVRTTYGQGIISPAGDVTVGAVNTGGNTNNWYSNFGDIDSIQYQVQNVVYTSGEMDGTTVVFDGFQNLSRVNIGEAGSIDYLVHTGPVGSTALTSIGNGQTIDLTSAGSSTSVFVTADTGAAGIRLRDLDLQFSTVPVPEPSSTALLGLAGLGLLARRVRK